MAKVTALTEITTPAVGDFFYVVDVSDTTDDPAGSSRKIRNDNLIAGGTITNAKLANVATATFKGRTTAGTGSPEDLTATQATALLNIASTSVKGLMSAADKTAVDNIASTAFINAIIFG